jgi:hypothetical protein
MYLPRSHWFEGSLLIPHSYQTVDFLRAVPFWPFFGAADKMLSKTDMFHRYFQFVYVYWYLYYHHMRRRRCRVTVGDRAHTNTPIYIERD